tara:strand:+ start:2378 stop:2644 length:267 start_codon:yes stop_codon:yes gene_type:complete
MLSPILPDQDYEIGDLIQVVQLKDESSYFKWPDIPATGIYMGELESTAYIEENRKTKIIVHKIWSLGKMRYVSSLEEIKLLAKIHDTI